MNCANHPDVPAVAYCRTCGKPLCSTCSRDVRGVIYCEECLASHLSGTMPPPGSTAVPPGVEPPAGTPSPTLAAVLGCIPGVGAMYNGEFAKGFIHVLIFATLIWSIDHVNGVFGIVLAAFYIYMPIEAYKTARAKQMGLPAPDPFGFNNLFTSSPQPTRAAGYAAVVPPAPPGVAQVVKTEPVAGRTALPCSHRCFYSDWPGRAVPPGRDGWLHFDWIWRFWPLILIAIGVRILMQRQQRMR